MVAQMDPMTPQVAVIGSMLIEPKLTGEVLTKVRAEDFSDERCQIIFQCIHSLFMEGQPVDAALVAGRLQSIPDIGRTIMDILHQTPTASNIWAYVDVLKEQSRLRSIRTYAMRLMEAGSVDEAQDVIAKLNNVFVSRPGVTRMTIQEMFQNFRERHQSGVRPEYFSWPFKTLNNRVFARQGAFILVGGYPSAGKTALSLQLAFHTAKTKRVGYYSLETDEETLSDRSVATLSQVEMKSILLNELAEHHWRQIDALERAVADRNLTVIRAAGMSVQDIQADALANRYEVVFIDYLQLIRPPRTANRTEAVTAISIDLHTMAQANKITVVALSQLSRPEKQKGGKEPAPTMASLRESGQLEQDANVILLLYKENPDIPNSRRVLKVEKNKEGETGKIYLEFDGKTQTFSEAKQSFYEGMREFREEERKRKQAPVQTTFRDISDEPDEDLPF